MLPPCPLPHQHGLGQISLSLHPQVEVVGDPHAGNQEREVRQAPHVEEPLVEADHIGILDGGITTLHVGALGILRLPLRSAPDRSLVAVGKQNLSETRRPGSNCQGVSLYI